MAYSCRRRSHAPYVHSLIRLTAHRHSRPQRSESPKRLGCHVSFVESHRNCLGIIAAMATATQIPNVQYLLLDNISWETYERLIREAGERHVRMTYDDGDLEIMTLSLGHEHFGELLASLVLILAMELSLPFSSGGSTTLR